MSPVGLSQALDPPSPTRFREVSFSDPPPPCLARAAVTSEHALGFNWCLLSPRSGGWKSETKASVGPVPSDGLSSFWGLPTTLGVPGLMEAPPVSAFVPSWPLPLCFRVLLSP